MPSTLTLGTPLIHFDTVDSTNRAALRAASEDAAEGTLFVADAQTAGRGRHSREWYSPPGLGLYFSVLLHPKISALEANNLVLQSAVAVCDAIEELYDYAVGIKWPNDIYSGNRKLGGILLETTITGDTIENAVIGIGLNMRHSIEDFPVELRSEATSLKEVTGKDITDTLLIERILSIYGDYYYKREECGIDKWIKRCIHMKKQIKINHNGMVLQGSFSEVSPDLSFTLKDEFGHENKIEYGEISLDMEV
ncbi:MAG: biotin--[acetyl-CoA-carboxylase] ligase [Candidatus Marinimicrobia bacterium]|nr:biotin--[acetyl-CoA-carboxylase] ligase [Candidatus Neomarinimicrobiota bacterium]